VAGIAGRRRGISMSNTLLIILAVALVAAGVMAWVLLSPGDAAPEAPETTDPDHVYVEPITVEPEPAGQETVVLEPPGPEETAPTRPSQLWAVDGVIDLGEYAHSTVVIDVTVHWLSDGNSLRVGLESPGTGYVAIGFDPVRGMEGANYIIGYVQEGEVFVRDDFGTGPTDHAPDTERAGQDNILASAGSEWADHTVLEFMIPLDSGDDLDKPLRPGGTYRILVSYHDLQDGFAARHSRRGSGEIQLDPMP
jgi:hypothetical protein